MIRPDLMNRVYNVLSSHPYLALEDFSMAEVPNKAQEPCLSIKYRPDRRFSVIFHIPKEKRKPSEGSYTRYLFDFTMRPGRESVEEVDVAEGRDDLISELREWLKRLHEDIVSAPVIRQFEEQSAALEQLREHLDKLPDEILSHEDIAEFREELDQIKAELTHQLKQTTSDKEELKRRIDEFGRDIELLKQTLASMTKRQWGQVFYIRVRKWSQKFAVSLRPLAATMRVTQRFLPEDTTAALDHVADIADGIADIAEKIPSSDGLPKE